MAEVTQDPEAWARLGVKIRERRDALGMSRRQLSAVAGVSEKSIQVAEDGRTPRARWPQSLRLIEAGLRWESGSMRAILEGGEPEPELDLFSSVERYQIPADAAESVIGVTGARRLEDLAHDRGEEFVTNHTRSRALAALPRGLRESLTEVLEFGRKAVRYGAAPGVADRYEKAVDDLIMDLIGRPIGHPAASHPSDPGHLAPWLTAIRMDPVQRQKREEWKRVVDRAQRQGKDWPPRTPVVGDVGSADVLNELRKLRQEVERLAERVDNGTESAGDS